MTFSQKLESAYTHLQKFDPVVGALIQKYPPCTIMPHTNHYAELIEGIVSQQLSVKAAATIWSRVRAQFNDIAPTPEQLLAADPEQLRACGVSYSKISYMKDLAEHIIDGSLDMTHIANLPNEALITQLTAVKGIGTWSAHMFMIFSLGRLDVLPWGDLGVRKAIMLQYKLSNLPDKAQVEAIATENNWSPYESVASWYLWKSLENK